jgi:hypothetical protein
MSKSTVDNGPESDRPNLLSLSVEDEADDNDWGWGLKGKLVESSFISQQFMSFLFLRSQPSP